MRYEVHSLRSKLLKNLIFYEKSLYAFLINNYMIILYACQDFLCYDMENSDRMFMNETIMQQIRAARSERGLSQKDLADHLGKTQATISDWERGKTQISASELYQIAELLNKPIEYFFGENIGDKEIQDIVAVLRKQPVKTRSSVLQLAGMIIQIQNIGDEATKAPESITEEKAREFYNLFIPFANTINAMSKKMDELRSQFEAALRVNEVKKPSKTKGKS